MRRLELALATCKELPDLTPDDRLVVEPLRSLEPDSPGAAGPMEATPAIWSEPSVRWSDFDGVVVRSCWDYHVRPKEFRSWLDHLDGQGIPIVNSHRLVTWNMDKRYLRELEAQGVRVPDTVFVEQGEATTLPEVFEAGELEGPFVVKPTISATANETWVTDAARARDDAGRFARILATSGAMVQRFVDEVRTEGEWSLVFFERAFSHAVRKRPADGDFRVQGEHGGSYHAEAAPEHLVRQAQLVLDRIEGPVPFARVDGIETDGELTLLELELIEPELFLRMHPAAPARFARSIAAAVAPDSPETRAGA